MTSIFAGTAGRSRFLLCGAAAAALITPAVSHAQDNSETSVDDDLASGNAIVVTATKREQTLQEVPVAVSVTSAETLERENIRDLRDLQTVVPSLRISQLQSSANSNFIIRGFGNGANNAGIEPSVGVFIDGVYRSRTAAQISDLPDVSRIEVLRGPQSTLFGKNASAGVISIVTKEPSFNFEGMAELSYGNYDSVVGKGYMSGPVSDDIALSFAAGFNERRGYNEDPGSGVAGNDRSRWFVRGQGLYDNGENLRFRLIGDYDQIDEVCCGVVNLQSSTATQAIYALGGAVSDPADPFANVIYNNFPSGNAITNQGLSGQFDVEFGDVTVTSITAYRETDAEFNQDPDFSSADLLGRYQEQDLQTFTQELRATGTFGPVTALVGLFYFDEKVREDQQITVGDAFRGYADLTIRQATGGTQTVGSLEQTIGALYGDPTQYIGQFFAPGIGENGSFTLENDAISVFGQLDIEVADGLVLTVGGNYTEDNKESVTNYQTTEVFSGIDLVDAGNRAIVAQGTPGAIALGLCANAPGFCAGASATPAEIQAFQTLQPGLFAQIAAGAQAQVQAFADANDTNGAVNPFLALSALQFFPRFLNIPNAVESGKTKDDNFSYTIRLAYDVNPDLNVYASYATGFKASSFNLSRDGRPRAADLAAIRAAGIATPNLSTGSRFAGPEESTVFEIGLKGDWGRYSANLTGFRQDIDGFQSNTFTGAGFFLANAGKQRTWGVEFEGVANPIDQLTLNLGLTWLDPTYVSYQQSPVGDISGATPAGISEWTASLGAQWEDDLANGDTVIVRGSYYYESEVTPVEGLPGFIALGQAAAIAASEQFPRQVNEINASITYILNDEGLELSLWGRNITNDRHIIQIFDTPAQPLSISGYPNQPRTYGATARLRF